MKFSITNKQIAWIVMITVSLTVLTLPFLGVIRGKQPMFYKTKPSSAMTNVNVIGLDGKVKSSEYRYTEEYVDYIHNYEYANATDGQKFMAIVRGITIATVSVSLIVIVIGTCAHVIDQNYSRVVVEIEPFKAQRLRREEADKLLKVGQTLRESEVSYPVVSQRGGPDSWT